MIGIRLRRALYEDTAFGIMGGILWSKSENKWLAMVKLEGKYRRVGSFDERNTAVVMQKEAKSMMENHMFTRSAGPDNYSMRCTICDFF